MYKFLILLTVTLTNIWSAHCGILDPLDEIKQSPGVKKLVDGFNEFVGKIGANLFPSDVTEKINNRNHFKKTEYRAEKTWEATSWTSVDDQERKQNDDTAPEENETAKIRRNESKLKQAIDEHEEKVHGKPSHSETLEQHENAYHGSGTQHTESLKDHERVIHHNSNSPCSSLMEHEERHHQKSSKYEKPSRFDYNNFIEEHELKYHNLENRKEDPSDNLEVHIKRFHPEAVIRTKEDEVIDHEERLHNEPACAYKQTCRFIVKHKSFVLWGAAALITLLLL